MILAVLDGLSAAVAEDTFGYLFALVEAKQASYQRIHCALPSMSRPLYETILTGRTPAESGIVHNRVVRKSQFESVFSLARAADLSTAAAAYHWFSELYNHAPFNYFTDRYQFDVPKEKGAIENGIFYHIDHYPDETLLEDAEFLRLNKQPDFLLFHSMNVDDTGHHFGGDSNQYRLASRNIDGLLSLYIPRWLAGGYRIIVTADHGMHADQAHSGRNPMEREIPFFALGEGTKTTSPPIQQTQISATICAQLGLTHPLHNSVSLWED